MDGPCGGEEDEHWLGSGGVKGPLPVQGDLAASRAVSQLQLWRYGREEAMVKVSLCSVMKSSQSSLFFHSLVYLFFRVSIFFNTLKSVIVWNMTHFSWNTLAVVATGTEAASRQGAAAHVGGPGAVCLALPECLHISKAVNKAQHICFAGQGPS